MNTATDYDHRIIDVVSLSLGGEIGGEDDVDRLLTKILATEPADRERALAEVAVAFIRWAQDLKRERDGWREAAKADQELHDRLTRLQNSDARQ